jgi:hypothetical protein
MKLHHVITLALCLHAPLTHNNNAQHDQCSAITYFGCTVLMGAAALCATGAYVAHNAIKPSSSRKRHDHAHDELKAFKYIFTASATALATSSIYCFNACINQQ